MKYYDNGPYLNSLKNAPAKSSTTLVVGLVVCLVFAGGAAIILHNQLKDRNIHIAFMQKEIQALKDINAVNNTESRNLLERTNGDSGHV
jgi:hypothetical protein